MASIFGTLFRVSTWGESHGGGVGCVIDGCPSRLPITPEEIQIELDRRRPGQSDIVTPRQEEDKCRILSGVFQGKTLGTPILVAVDNKDARPSAYTEMETMFRPSHADYTYQAKYGIRNWEGGVAPPPARPSAASPPASSPRRSSAPSTPPTKSSPG